MMCLRRGCAVASKRRSTSTVMSSSVVPRGFMIVVIVLASSPWMRAHCRSVSAECEHAPRGLSRSSGSGRSGRSGRWWVGRLTHSTYQTHATRGIPEPVGALLRRAPKGLLYVRIAGDLHRQRSMTVSAKPTHHADVRPRRATTDARTQTAEHAERAEKNVALVALDRDSARRGIGRRDF